MNTFYTILWGVVGSIIATIIIGIFVYYYRKWIKNKLVINEKNKKLLELGMKMDEQGLTAFHFSRDDYGRTLASFIDGATQSITIVSISLKNTHDEGKLTDIFRKKLAQNPTFKIEVSLVNPNNASLVKVASDTLNVKKEYLQTEIKGMISELGECYLSLHPSERTRFKIMHHDCFPMGSVVMLDATPTGGIIQVETKLYKTARSESFGFQITKESKFYKTNYSAWNRIISDSKPINFNRTNVKPKNNKK